MTPPLPLTLHADCVFIDSRRRRSKCDGGQPCTNCQRYREECTYDQFPVRRGQDKEQRVRSPAGVHKPRKTGSRRDDDYDEPEAGASGHY